jgi:NIMA (never in mitosis gene a)-related kinase
MLGCVLYELCTLRHPFEGKTIPQVVQKITRHQYEKLDGSMDPLFEKLLEMLLHKKASERSSA